MELSIRDKKMLFLLDSDSREPLNSLGSKLRISKEAVFYKIRDMEEKKMMDYALIVNLSKLGLMHFKLYIKLQNIQKQKKAELIKNLKENSSINWLIITRGTYDLVCGFILKDIFEFSKSKEDIISRYSDYIHSTNYSVMLHPYYFGRKYLSNGNSTRDYDANSKKEELDRVDYRILKKLSVNTRMKSTELAKSLDITPKIASYRISSMEKKGIILGYTISINHSYLGISYFKAFFYLKDKAMKKKLLNHLSLQKNCIFAMEVLGNWDIESEFEVFSTEEYYRLMDDIEEKFSSNIKTITTLLIEKEVKFRLLPEKVSGLI